MKNVEKSTSILFYSVNLDYFISHSKLSTSRSVRNNLRTASNGTYIFSLNFNFEAKSDSSNEHFIQYASWLQVSFIKDDFNTDYRDISQIVDEYFLSVFSFIKENSISNFDRLNMDDFKAPTTLYKRIEVLLLNLDELKPYDDKSFDEKEIGESIAKKIPKMSFAPKVKFAGV
jgi:hypothetical protein